MRFHKILTPELLNCCEVNGGGLSLKNLDTASSWNVGLAKMLLKPPPLKITCSHAPSGSFTVFPGSTCVAPTAVTKGQVTGKPGLKRTPFRAGRPTLCSEIRIVFVSA